MTKMYESICYIYDTYIFRGFMRQMHGEGYSKEHALGVFAFIQLLNAMTILNILHWSDLVCFDEVRVLVIGVVLYFLNRYFLIDKKLKGKPSGLMIAAAISYTIASVAAFFLSLLAIVPSR